MAMFIAQPQSFGRNEIEHPVLVRLEGKGFSLVHQYSDGMYLPGIVVRARPVCLFAEVDVLDAVQVDRHARRVVRLSGLRPVGMYRGEAKTQIQAE